MPSTVGLEIMDSINPQLNWKTVTKGRRTRTAVARRKLSAAVSGQPTSQKTEHVPIKKRRHLLRSPSPQPRTPSISRQDSSSQPYSSSPLFEDNYAYLSDFSVLRAASLYSNWKLINGSSAIKFGEGFDYGILSEQVGGEHNYVGDFSGIELLAAAASMDDDADNAFKNELVLEDSLIPKSSDMPVLATQFKQDPECNKSSSNEIVLEDDTDCSVVRNNLESAAQCLLECYGDGTMTRTDSLKVDRRHWDLNTLMDAWDEPCNDKFAGKTSRDVANNDRQVEEGRQGGSGCQVLTNPGVTGDKFSDLEVEEDKSIAVSPHGKCIESSTLKETLMEPGTICYSNVTTKTSDQDTGKKGDLPSALVPNFVSPASSAPNTNSHTASVENVDLKSIFIENINFCTPSAENIDSPLSSAEKVDLHVASAEKVEPRVSSAEKIDSYTGSAENIDSQMASSGKIELDMASAEKIDSTVDAQIYSDVCLDNHNHVVDSGDDLARSQEGHDSPYEDGELRGSFLYPWEENESDNKHVDYESDGRHGDSSDAGDLHGSEIVDGGSDGSHSSVRKSLLAKRFLGRNESNCRSFKHSFMQFVEDESENNDRGGKNELDIDLVIGENENERRLLDQTDAIDDSVAHMDKYLFSSIQGKVQSCSKGRSSLETFKGKDIFFLQQYRSRHLGGSDFIPERDTGPYKYLRRYRHATHGSEKGGTEQWTYWGSKRRYTSTTYHQGVEGSNLNRPRRITGDLVDKFGRVDFDHKRQNSNYLSKGYLRRPLVRSPPVDRDDRFGVRRMPLTRRIKENYRLGVGKKYEPLPDNASKSVRPSPYLLSRERSFSSSSGRGVHIPLTRRRSRSRSRTRSPTAWHSSKGREMGTRRHIRSPDFRSEARMDRMKFQNSNSTFTSDYREGYLSPPRGRFPPQHNGRWFDDLDFTDNHLRRRRSPVRLVWRPQKFDAVGSSGRLKVEGYFKPTIRPGRFSFLANDGREAKFETSYEDRRHDDRGEVMHWRQDADNSGNSRRFRQPADADVIGTSNSSSKDDARGTDPSNVPQR